MSARERSMASVWAAISAMYRSRFSGWTFSARFSAQERITARGVFMSWAMAAVVSRVRRS